MVAVPGVLPVTTPAGDIVAAPLLPHVPPVGAPLSVMVAASQTMDGPVMTGGAGGALTVTTKVADVVPHMPVVV
jgi:hypothetical protein